ncbi:MAG: hypothetical protein IKD42_05195 [Kiritimatiellae bacterium]|nr:hypothetical protein [Kiritimatiellia bacterium]
MENDNPQLFDIGSFDFTPDWAKKEEKVTLSTGAKREFSSGGEARPRQEKKAPRLSRDRRPERRDRPVKSASPRVEFEVKALPEPSALGTIIRKIQQSSQAFKLKDLAYLFLDNPSSVLLKITPKDKTLSPFRQCKACSFASDDESEIAEHAVSAHLGDYFEKKEIECEAPKGNFACVARCSLTGVLLGPPNVHEFNSVVKETAARLGMSEADYRTKIEMVRDSEAIEEWRKRASKKTVYVEKGAAEGETLSRIEAEARFRRTIMRELVASPKTLMVPASSALASRWGDLRRAAAAKLEAERRAPAEMCFALRGAFHHKNLRFFRVNDNHGQEFVTSVEYKVFDAAHAIPELAGVARYIACHPCRARNAIAPDAETAKHLDWLVSTGHVVAFSNGVYSEVEQHPKYGPQWQNKTIRPADGADEPGPAAEKAEEKEDKEVLKDEDTPELAE